MSELPVISGKEAQKAFENAGWRFKRFSKKNHIIMKKGNSIVHLSIPNHKKLDRGLLRDLIKDSGLTVEEFKKILQ